MNLIKITDLTRQLGLSSRTLRYYEQMGLIESIRLPSETYRYYDTFSVQRLHQIIILRKMQIPVKEILRIYENPDISTLVEAFAKKIAEIDREVTALSELKEIINSFLHRMTEKGITKISALPLLYEEMEKQAELLEAQGRPVHRSELVPQDSQTQYSDPDLRNTQAQQNNQTSQDITPPWTPPSSSCLPCGFSPPA